eukprot:gnl/Chilomastix_cuspidata/2583.p1 GENE.gnl/Chilomastix_cuspidata/2583~~gnl/Chilomastix_cuspidata/2583.p1  ORF type:complete len:934 (-),score=373.50 gnl/Chilomastix_cuspidata/2583:3-2804(-)
MEYARATRLPRPPRAPPTHRGAARSHGGPLPFFADPRGARADCPRAMDRTCFHSTAIQDSVVVQILNVRGEILSVLESKSDGSTPRQSRDMYVSVEVSTPDALLTPPICSAFQNSKSNYCLEWNETIELPIKYCDLPFDAQLVFRVFALVGNAGVKEQTEIGFATFRVFQRGSCALDIGQTTLDIYKEETDEFDAAMKEDLRRATTVMEKAPRDEAALWLDRLASSEMERLNQLAKSADMSLAINLLAPRLPEKRPILFHHGERFAAHRHGAALLYNLPLFSTDISTSLQVPAPPRKASAPLCEHPFLFVDSGACPGEVRAAHSPRVADAVARFLEAAQAAPGLEVIEQLRRLIRKPNSAPFSAHDRQFVWRWRHFIPCEIGGILLFARCAHWDERDECMLVMERMGHKATFQDFLSLLAQEFAFPWHCSSRVPRQFAIRKIALFPPDVIVSFLLFFVYASVWDPPDSPSLRRFLITLATEHPGKFRMLQWHLRTAIVGTAPSDAVMPPADDEEAEFDTIPCVSSSHFTPPASLPLLDTHTPYPSPVFFSVFLAAVLQKTPPEAKAEMQKDFGVIADLHAVSMRLRRSGLSRPKKIELLQQLLREETLPGIMPRRPTVLNFTTAPFTFDKVVVERAHVFKSEMNPILLTLRGAGADTGRQAYILFKSGDDVRKDEAIMCFITLMDDILRAEGMDLCLSPYRALATSPSSGLVECVIPNMSVQDILTQFKTISRFFAHHAPLLRGEAEPLVLPDGVDVDMQKHILPSQLDNFIRSCSGYAVITYLLGIGDRHLENILVRPDGRLFHIDFGFILGRDPKPLPPKIKINKEMVEAMGGPRSYRYVHFLSLTCEAFRILRRHCNLFNTLFSLLGIEGVDTIREDAATRFAEFDRKFWLDLHDTEATHGFIELIESCTRAIFPVALDAFHKWIQNRRE